VTTGVNVGTENRKNTCNKGEQGGNWVPMDSSGNFWILYGLIPKKQTPERLYTKTGKEGQVSSRENPKMVTW